MCYKYTIKNDSVSFVIHPWRHFFVILFSRNDNNEMMKIILMIFKQQCGLIFQIKFEKFND